MSARPRAARPIAALLTPSLLLACAGDPGALKVLNDLPAVTLTSPEDGAAFLEGATVTLRAEVSDRETPLDQLEVQWQIAGDVLCEGTATPSADGQSTCEVVLDDDATITVTVFDGDGGTAEDVASVTVTDNAPPEITLLSPTDADTLYADLPVALSATVSDAEDDPDALTVTWLSGDDPLSPAGAGVDSSGAYTGSVSLAEGTHVLKAEVTDTLGKTSSETVTVIVWGDNEAPVCEITAPASGSAFALGDTVTLEGNCTDTETAPSLLSGVVSSSIDGELVSAVTFSTAGDFAASLSGLSAGSHQVTLTVTDDYGDRAVEFVTIEICDDAWFPDSDGDGYGDAAGAVYACAAPSGLVADGTDCDDTDGDTFPGAAERDSSSACMTDADADGYGDTAPTAGITAGTDCDDAEPAVHPAASEVCDSIDNDCDGDIDDDDASVDTSTGDTFYADSDGDGYGDAGATTQACAQPSGFTADATDCDDGAAGVNPGATEICDSADVDEDCDGAADDADSSVDMSGFSTFYADSDGDTYGDSASTTAACDAPTGHVTDATDCDDGDSAVHPGATEICDADDTDEDCDGAADDADSSVDTSGYSTFYADSDGDGYGDSASTSAACDAPSGTTSDATDCDDGAAGVNPGATEVCDSADTDEDCDGLADDADASVDASTLTTFYADADSDGYGDPSVTTAACDQPSGTVTDLTDCDDADAWTYPGATELCDGEQNDCADTAWVSDAGLASFYDDTTALWSDQTSTLGAGISASPAAITLADAGQYNVCAGTWYAHLTIEADVDVVGIDGAALVTLDGGNADSVVTVLTDTITVGLTDLTLSGGLATRTPSITTSTSTYGGGVHCDATSNLVLDSLVVTDNHADVGGGLFAGYCDVTAADVTWQDNTADVQSAGVYAVYDTWVEADGWYEGNEAPAGGGARFHAADVTLDDVVFTDNTGTTGGYAAFMVGHSSTLTATGLTVTDHQSGSAASGGQYYGGAVWVYSSTTATFEDAAFDDNISDNLAGALYIYSADVDCTDCSFERNTAAGAGGALYVRSSSTLDIDGSSSITDNATDTYGGGLYVDTSQVTLDGVTVSGNTADLTGGGAVFTGSATTGSTVTLTGGSFEDNLAGGTAGGLAVRYATLEATGTDLSGNVATDEGGAIYIDTGGEVTLDTCTVDDNEGTVGGAIYSDGGDLSVTDSSFTTNSSSSYAGAINVESATLTLSDTTFTQNTGGTSVGAVRVNGSGSVASIDTCAFDRNEAQNGLTGGGGGALQVRNGVTLDIIDSTFTDNVATLTSGSGNGGGAIWAWTGNGTTNTISIEDTTFSGNESFRYGGAIWARFSALTLDGVDFDANTGTHGGALMLSDSSLTSTGLTWTNNAATYAGGIYLYGSTATVTANSMSGNSAYDTYNQGGTDYDNWGTTSFSCTTTTCN